MTETVMETAADGMGADFWAACIHRTRATSRSFGIGWKNATSVGTANAMFQFILIRTSDERRSVSK